MIPSPVCFRFAPPPEDDFHMRFVNTSIPNDDPSFLVSLVLSERFRPGLTTFRLLEMTGKTHQ